MGINEPTDEYALSAEEESQAVFNDANAPWRAKYTFLRSKLLAKGPAFFGTPHALHLDGNELKVTVHPNVHNGWLIDVQTPDGTVKQVQCEEARLRVLHDGVHVFIPSMATNGQNTQPIQPYHGAPFDEKGRQACRDIQVWLNPVVDFLCALTGSTFQK